MAYTEKEIKQMKEELGITDNDEIDDKDETTKIQTFDLTGLEYILMPKADTYALGVEALRNSCLADPLNAQPLFRFDQNTKLFRPLTFEENIRARVNDYETLQDENGNERDLEARTRLFKTRLDSITGIAYKSKTNKFKIITECSELINIVSNFNKEYLPIDYNEINGIELDRSQGIYNQLLTLRQVLEHPAWNIAIQDKSLLKTYTDLFFKLNPGNERMGFWIGQNTKKGELRALNLNNVDSNSSAGGNGSLNYSACFLRVIHKENNIQKIKNKIQNLNFNNKFNIKFNNNKNNLESKFIKNGLNLIENINYLSP